jgi:hypothetical protein
MYVVRVSARTQFGTAFVLFSLSDGVAMAIVLWAISLTLLIFAIGAFITGLRIIWFSIKARLFWWGNPT